VSAGAPRSMAFAPVLIATKLRVPAVREGSVIRRDLVARLVAGSGRKLMLVCAPAGWGKTVLLSEWCVSSEEERPFAWVSLDPADDDPVRFWSYVIGALQTVKPGIGATASALLPAAGPSLVEAVLPPLLNELAAVDRRLVLVLDDYHLVRDELIHDSVASLLRHLPATVQVAIATRADPPLPLGSLRAASEVTELRAAELGFDVAEAEALLNGSLGLSLTPTEVQLLQVRTEGWAAGLRLAALSVEAHEDRSAFVQEFAGDDRQIGDYLHEVLAEQPTVLRDFLLRTSILERLCAPLCDAVVDGRDSAERLGQLTRSNLFLIPLDSRNHWFRYHQLFRDLLRSELAKSDPGLEAGLHRRASAWHAAEGEAEEAIAHATAAGDVGDAGELIVSSWSAPFDRGEIKTVAGWVDRLPREAILADARLCLIRAWAALFLGRLDEIETWRAAADVADLSVPVHNGIPGLLVNSAAFDATVAYRLGDVGRANEADHRAVAAYPDASDPRRAFATINLGETQYYAGDHAAAAASFAEVIGRLSGLEWPVSVVAANGYLAAIRVDGGDVAAAGQALAEAERLMDEFELGETPCARPVLLARGMLLELRGDLAQADAAFAGAASLARRGGWPLELGHALILHAGLKRRRQEYLEARALARDARQVLAGCLDPGVLAELLAKTEHALQMTARSRGPQALQAHPELSERELAVLRLLASELSQREIGSELFISLNTVKGHVRSIFRELGVTTRAAAVARGRELDLT
jgi:LuxR family maltose regulon positive regulatory protein